MFHQHSAKLGRRCMKKSSWKIVPVGEGEVHEANDGEAQQSDGVRPVEEVSGDVLHLLLIDHPKCIL
ncbi:hypothetical protein MDA_GLEAN10002024 [Myotis davidii]|uniref:Uncharacterized protein n=1 Tax=Myotis davidii TaxID=225400 RepID=L5MHK1_MYODS|nr:hypothetical protein MDA_GLEAN10002024 [Myotis davidii]